ncbi:hypothetical protein IIA79_07705 [bacterium]|nr:hypothetical protein [bacterium]
MRLLAALAGAALFLVAMGAICGSAAQAQLPYASVEWYEFPEPGVLSAGLERQAALFPDWQPGMILKAEYLEDQFAGDLPLATITVRSRRFAYLSVIYYSPAGLSYEVLSSLPLPGNHETTVSFEVPAGEPGGLARMLLWERPAHPGWLTQLAHHPNFREEPVAGVVAERWFARGGGGFVTPPWEDPFRDPPPVPDDYAGLSWPWCRAQPLSDMTVRSKDCAVLYTGFSRLAIDERGSYGQWPLGWGSSLNLVFELPEAARVNRAHIYLYGAAGPPGLHAAAPLLEVAVNGWPLSSFSFAANRPQPAQPVIIDVSHYLQAGENRVHLRVDALGGEDWLIDGIELWID